jgi:hypothetical protein
MPVALHATSYHSGVEESGFPTAGIDHPERDTIDED